MAELSFRDLIGSAGYLWTLTAARAFSRTVTWFDPIQPGCSVRW